MRKKKLYRAVTGIGAGMINYFDLEANNKKEVEKRIKEFGFDVKDWIIERIC